MRPILVSAGMRFGFLTVVREAMPRDRNRKFICRCDCGQERKVHLSALRHGLTTSCGHVRADKARARYTHGETRGGRSTPEYTAWGSMITRCENPNVHNYASYGGRGVRVCSAWRGDFAAFLAHVGRRPSPRHSIDRIDNDGNYEPGNVRWATTAQQNRNQRDNLFVEVEGRRVLLKDAAETSGVPLTTARRRLSRGLPIEEVLSP